jgi:8-hydroxy-5-deazaflavin:NADPH oxidoreductase
VDPTNPVDFGTVELLDRAWLGPFSSGGELIEAAAPDDASLVKAFNTNFAGPLYAGAVDGSPLDAFVAGDDQTAKDTIMRLASDGGLRAIDAGRFIVPHPAVRVLAPRTQTAMSGHEVGTY